jgi:hypothetical protein
VPRRSPPDRKFLDDAVQVRACQLRLRPGAERTDVLTDGPGQPVFFRWSTHGRSGRVTLTCARARGEFEVRAVDGNFGLTWHFRGADGHLRRRCTWTLDERTGRGTWGFREDLPHLGYACRHLGVRARMRREREKLVREQMALEDLEPVSRLREIENRLETIRRELV